jgi:hypothetical protein
MGMNPLELLKQEPVVDQIQIDLMVDIGFVAVKRDNSWVLWELKNWPEVKIWLQSFQSDISQQFILMQVFKAGIASGRLFQCNEIRLSIGLPCMTDVDVERISGHENPWLAIHMNPRHV